MRGLPAAARLRDVAEMLLKALGCWTWGHHDEPRGVWIAAANAKNPGGGAVREVVEVLLKAQGHWDQLLRKYEVVKPW